MLRAVVRGAVKVGEVEEKDESVQLLADPIFYSIETHIATTLSCLGESTRRPGERLARDRREGSRAWEREEREGTGPKFQCLG